MKVVNIEGIGDVIFVKNNRSKKYYLRVNKLGEVRVTIPMFGTYKFAVDYVQSKKDWIIDGKSKISAAKGKKVYSIGRIDYNEKFSISISTHDKMTVKSQEEISRQREIINILVPSTVDIQNAELQSIVSEHISKIMLNAAKNVLPSMIEEISQATRLSYSGLRISSAQRRWGSCSSTNSISLSKNLIKLPTPLINFVIIHELCHTKHKNHGKYFHALVDSYCGGKEKQLAKELRQIEKVLL